MTQRQSSEPVATVALGHLEPGTRFRCGGTRGEVIGPGPCGGVLVQDGRASVEWSRHVRVEVAA